METKGIVLKVQRLGEGLRALSLYTELIGRVNTIVKVRKGEFPIKYEPFSISQFEIVQMGDKFEVKRAKLLKENFPKSKLELDYRTRLVKPLIFSQFPGSRKLFSLIEFYIGLKGNFEVAYPMFISKLLFIEGLFPQVKRCVSCGKAKIVAFSVNKGGTVCIECKEEKDMNWSKEHSRELIRITKGPFEEIKKSYRKDLLPTITQALHNHLRERLG